MVMLLCKKLRNGDIPAKDNTKSVWEAGSLLLIHKLHNFWTKCNLVKDEEEITKILHSHTINSQTHCVIDVTSINF